MDPNVQTFLTFTFSRRIFPLKRFIHGASRSKEIVIVCKWRERETSKTPTAHGYEEIYFKKLKKILALCATKHMKKENRHPFLPQIIGTCNISKWFTASYRHTMWNRFCSAWSFRFFFLLRMSNFLRDLYADLTFFDKTNNNW